MCKVALRGARIVNTHIPTLMTQSSNIEYVKVDVIVLGRRRAEQSLNLGTRQVGGSCQVPYTFFSPWTLQRSLRCCAQYRDFSISIADVFDQ